MLFVLCTIVSILYVCLCMVEYYVIGGEGGEPATYSRDGPCTYHPDKLPITIKYQNQPYNLSGNVTTSLFGGGTIKLPKYIIWYCSTRTYYMYVLDEKKLTCMRHGHIGDLLARISSRYNANFIFDTETYISSAKECSVGVE